MKIFAIVLLIIVALCVIIYVLASILEKKREAEILEARKNRYRSFIARFDKKYGTCSEIIKNPTEYEYDTLRVYKESEVFVINEKALRFADIISSKVELDHTSVQYAAKPVETSDVDMTSLLTRSAIGSFLGGNVGMLIGGLSAKRKKTVQMVPDSIANNYCLIIETTLKQHPTKKFQFYEDIDLARRVSKTINRTLNTYKQEKKRMS